MHNGEFLGNTPLIPLVLVWNEIVKKSLFVLDTGFTGDLQTTVEIADYFGLEPMGISEVTLANGETVGMPFAYINAEIENEIKSVSILICNSTLTAGIGLFSKFEYTIILDCKKRTVQLKK